jgi:hypothetical protein
VSGGERLRLRRPFGLLDGLILLVPVAIGCAVARPYLQHAQAIRPQEWRWRWKEITDHSERITSRFIGVGMPGLLVVCLRHPRPGLRRLSRQPGAVACAAAVAVMVAGGLFAGSMAIVQDLPSSRTGRFRPHFMPPPPARPMMTRGFNRPVLRAVPFRPSTTNFYTRPESIWTIFQTGIAPAVGAAWTALIVGRRWRAEPTWIDRAGRCCGFYWIALAVCRWVRIVVGG